MNRLLTFLSTIATALLLMVVAVPNAYAQNGTANLQVIHNSPDPAVSSVDIFVNGDPFLSGVDFRAATAFDEVPAGVELSIQIAPADAGIENAVGPFDFTLEEGENYILVASGVVDTEAYPDAAPFSLEAFTPAQTSADDPSTVAVNIHHGSPDAPAVDIYTNQTGEDAAVPGLAFPEFTGYVALAPDNEVVGIAGAGGDVLVEFSAPFADLGLEGSALTVLASGFFDAESAGEGNGFGLLAVLANGTTVLLDVIEPEPEPANVQIIHNSADPDAASVDIFVNGDLALPGVAFRTATEFIELPGDTPLTITVSPADAGIGAGVEFEGVEFTSGENFYVVATGVLDPSDFATNPDGVDTGFFLDVIPEANMSAAGDDFEFLIYHGSTDAPAVDIAARNVATLVDNAAYTDFTPDYIAVPSDEYIIDIFPAGSDDLLIAYNADVSALGGSTAVVLASGFLDPTANNDGEGFALIVVLADGTVVTLDAVEPETATANLQIIHNSPDPAVSSVDIFVNGDPFLSGVDFRAATAFDEVPACVELSIQIAPADAGIENAVGPFDFTLEEGENYILVASGVVDTEAYPDAVPFSLEAFTPAQTSADDPSTVAVNIHHGSPDAPAVDIYTNQTGEDAAVPGLAFPEFTGYVQLSPDNEVVGIAGAGGDVLVEFSAPFADLGLEGAALTVLASGFFTDYAGDDNGFGLLAVLADGTTVLLDAVEPEPTTANVQIIHNSPDPAAESVDVFVNGDLALPGVAFRTATEFIELPGDTPLTITVSPADAGIGEGIEFEGVEFASGENFYVVATGVLDPSGFAANPDGVDTGFFLDVIPNASLAAEEDAFDFLIYHGAPDAPAVDIAARDVAALADGISYTDYSSEYISVPANTYIIDIFAAGAETPLVSFDADVSDLGGATGVILASGFLNPAANSDGPAFGAIVVLADGTVVELGVATSTEDVVSTVPERFELNQNYPNPFNPTTTISYSLPEASDVRVEIFNVTGQHIATIVDAQQSAGQYTVNFDASSLSSGVYLYRIQADNFTQTRRMTLIK